MSHLAELTAKQDNLKRTADAIASHDGDGNRSGLQKQRFQETTLPIYQCVANTFYEIWKNFNEKYKSNVCNQDGHPKQKKELEIEIRLGAIVLNNYRYKSQITEKLAIVITDQHRKSYGSNLTFVSGIDETHAKHLQSKVLTSQDFEITKLVRTNIIRN